jgi:hypothetical protein
MSMCEAACVRSIDTIHDRDFVAQMNRICTMLANSPKFRWSAVTPAAIHQIDKHQFAIAWCQRMIYIVGQAKPAQTRVSLSHPVVPAGVAIRGAVDKAIAQECPDHADD